MKYLLVIILVALIIKPLSYAKFNWKNNNRLGAVGCILLVLLSFSISVYTIFVM